MDESLLFDAPIPGQSLTQNPENKMPYEQPPEFTDQDAATEYLLNSILDNSSELIDIVSQGIPLETLTQQIAFAGFANGKWNPDLMLLLIEPILYILLFVCEQAGVDYVLSFDEDAEYLEQEDVFQAESKLKSDKLFARTKSKGEINPSGMEKIKSLLAKAQAGKGVQ